MKVKVIKSFIDKNTRNLHKVGETITVSNERFEELTSTSRGIFVEEIVDKVEEKPNKEKQPKEPKESKKSKSKK